MAWLPAPPSGSAAASAFALGGSLDAEMTQLRDYVAAAAAVVSREEFTNLTAEYEQIRDEAAHARALLDQAAATHSPADTDPAADDAYAEAARQLGAAVEMLEQPTIALRRIANVKAETEFAAARLADQIGKGHLLLSRTERPDHDLLVGRLRAAEQVLQQAAAVAAERHWVRALDTVEAAADDVAEVIVVLEAKPEVDEARELEQARAQMSALLAEVQASGSSTASAYVRLRQQSAEAAADRDFQAAAALLRSAGAVFADVRAVVADHGAGIGRVRTAIERLQDAQQKIAQVADQVAATARQFS